MYLTIIAAALTIMSGCSVHCVTAISAGWSRSPADSKPIATSTTNKTGSHERLDTVSSESNAQFLSAQQDQGADSHSGNENDDNKEPGGRQLRQRSSLQQASLFTCTVSNSLFVCLVD